MTRESALPGLSEWARVRDWRLGQLQQSANAELYLESPLSAEDVMAYGIPDVLLATGSTWRADGVGRAHRKPLSFLKSDRVLTPDDVMTGKLGPDGETGPVVVFDDDRFYMGSVLAEKAAASGRDVVFVTPSPVVAPWADHTLEQVRIQKRMIDLGVEIIASHHLVNLIDGTLSLGCGYSAKTREIACGTLITVTSRHPRDELWTDLQARQEQWQRAGVRSVTRIGDSLAPGLIVAAVYSGQMHARDLLAEPFENTRREDVKVV